MIVREWRGIARREGVEDYLSHFSGELLPKLRGLAGFRGAEVLRRDAGKGVEVTVLTRWDSMDEIRAFTGDDAEVAVVAACAQPLFVSFDKHVKHHAVAVGGGAFREGLDA